MDLDKITVIDRRARKAKSIIDAVEQLPMNIPNTRDCWVEAFYHGVEPGIRLNFLYSTENEAKKITLTAPKGASNVKTEEHTLEFDYKGQHYKAYVGVDDV